MTFATEVLKPASERFVLVKITPRKWLGTGTSIGSNQYTFSPDLDRVDTVQINGSDISSGDWTYAGGVLTVTSLLDLTTGNYVTVDFHLFLTGSKTRDTTAGVSGLPSEIWEPLLLSYPDWAQSMRDITEGVFSLSDTEIRVISTDRWAHEMLSGSFSFHRAPVYIWACVNSEENNRVVFNGEIIKADVKPDSIYFQAVDTFQKLDETAAFGNQPQAYAYNSSAFTPYLSPEYQGLAIPLVMGITSPLIMSPGYRISEAFGASGATNMYHLSDGLNCIPVTDSLDTATSVTFLCGRIIGTAVKLLTFGTISAGYRHYVQKTVYGSDYAGGTDAAYTIDHKFIYLNCSGFNGDIGDYVPLADGISDAWVCAVGQFTHAATTFNLALCTVDYEYYNAPGTSGSFSPSIPNNTYHSMSVWVDGTQPAQYKVNNIPAAFVPIFIPVKYTGRYVPFTVSYGTSYSFGGQTITHVYATVAKADIGDEEFPGRLKMKCRFAPGNSHTHGEAMKIICEAAGLDTNAASFTQADVDLDANVVLSTPAYQSTEFPKYLELAQSIARSTFSMLRVNEDREVEYILFSNPQVEATTGTRNAAKMLVGDTSATVDYQDIYSDFVFENPQYKGRDSLHDSVSGPSALVSLFRTKYLYKIDRTKTIKHVLDDIYGRKDTIAAYYGEATATYRLSTASEDLASNIGDVVEIDNNIVPNDDTTINGVVVDIQATPSKTMIKLNELRGI